MLKALKARYYPSAGTGGYTVTGYQSMLGLARAAAGLSGAVTPASVTAALKAARDVPAGDGLTFTCDGKQIAGLSSACSPGLAVLTITNGQGLDPRGVRAPRGTSAPRGLAPVQDSSPGGPRKPQRRSFAKAVALDTKLIAGKPSTDWSSAVCPAVARMTRVSHRRPG